MGKTKLCGMKKLSADTRQFKVAHKKSGRRAINRVSDKRMLHCGKMYTDLMRPAGVELDFEQSRRSELGEFAPLGAGFAYAADRIAITLA